MQYTNLQEEQQNWGWAEVGYGESEKVKEQKSNLGEVKKFAKGIGRNQCNSLFAKKCVGMNTK
jgi:hypothetical protein